jgi:hypothetical protein
MKQLLMFEDEGCTSMIQPEYSMNELISIFNTKISPKCEPTSWKEGAFDQATCVDSSTVHYT